MKTFDELCELNISAKVKKHNGLDYLNWLDCFLMLRELGMMPVYGVSSIQELPISGQIIVTVWVEIGETRCEITYTDSRSRDFEFIKQRAFVKCIAINWGLGLKLWENTSDATGNGAPSEDDIISAITMAFDAKRTQLGLATADELHTKLGTTKAFLSRLLSEGSKKDQYDFLAKLKNFQTDEPF